MKKKILAMLLSALLVMNISACNFSSQSENGTTGLNFEETDEKATESEKNADIKAIENEQLDLSIETLQAIFPSFTAEDFNGVDPFEYQAFINEIGKATATIINRAQKN